MAQAKRKSNSTVTTQWEGSVLTVRSVALGKAFMFDETKASATNSVRARQHGWTQRICDKMAKSAPKREVGMGDAAWAVVKLRHEQARFDAARALAEYYESGDVSWKLSGGGASDGGLLVTALCRLRPDRTLEQVTKFLETRTPEDLKRVRARKDVVEMMNQVRLERAGAGDGGEDVLAGLDEMDGGGEDDDGEGDGEGDEMAEG